MKARKGVNIAKPKVGETIADLKNESVKAKPVQKGYNEKNPSQPEGAFKPDATNKKG